MAQVIERSTLDFGSGHDLTVRGFKPRVRLCADSLEPGACFGFCVSLSLSLPLPCSHALSLSLSKLNIKKKFKDTVEREKESESETKGSLSLSSWETITIPGHQSWA